LIEVEYINHLYPIEGYIEKLIPPIEDYVISGGYWIDAIKIERNNRILDGHHRFEVAKRLDLRKIPVVRFNYRDLEMWSLRDEFDIEINDVYRKSLLGDIYPEKTVKHRFPDVNCMCKINISKLR
jgi:hypothetical protein